MNGRLGLLYRPSGLIFTSLRIAPPFTGRIKPFSKRNASTVQTTSDTSQSYVSPLWSSLSQALELYTNAFLQMPHLVPWGTYSDAASYASCIIALTLGLRMTLLPLTLWQRKKLKFVTETIEPEQKKYIHSILPNLIKQCKRAGKSKIEFERILGQEVGQNL